MPAHHQMKAASNQSLLTGDAATCSTPWLKARKPPQTAKALRKAKPSDDGACTDVAEQRQMPKLLGAWPTSGDCLVTHMQKRLPESDRWRWQPSSSELYVHHLHSLSATDEKSAAKLRGLVQDEQDEQDRRGNSKPAELSAPPPDTLAMAVLNLSEMTDNVLMLLSNAGMARMATGSVSLQPGPALPSGSKRSPQVAAAAAGGGPAKAAGTDAELSHIASTQSCSQRAPWELRVWPTRAPGHASRRIKARAKSNKRDENQPASVSNPDPTTAVDTAPGSRTDVNPSFVGLTWPDVIRKAEHRAARKLLASRSQPCMRPSGHEAQDLEAMAAARKALHRSLSHGSLDLGLPQPMAAVHRAGKRADDHTLRSDSGCRGALVKGSLAKLLATSRSRIAQGADQSQSDGVGERPGGDSLRQYVEQCCSEQSEYLTARLVKFQQRAASVDGNAAAKVTAGTQADGGTSTSRREAEAALAHGESEARPTDAPQSSELRRDLAAAATAQTTVPAPDPSVEPGEEVRTAESCGARQAEVQCNVIAWELPKVTSPPDSVAAPLDGGSSNASLHSKQYRWEMPAMPAHPPPSSQGDDHASDACATAPAPLAPHSTQWQQFLAGMDSSTATRQGHSKPPKPGLPAIKKPFNLAVDPIVVESLVMKPTYNEVSQLELHNFEKAVTLNFLGRRQLAVANKEQNGNTAPAAQPVDARPRRRSDAMTPMHLLSQPVEVLPLRQYPKAPGEMAFGHGGPAGSTTDSPQAKPTGKRRKVQAFNSPDTAPAHEPGELAEHLLNVTSHNHGDKAREKYLGRQTGESTAEKGASSKAPEKKDKAKRKASAKTMTSVEYRAAARAAGRTTFYYPATPPVVETLEKYKEVSRMPVRGGGRRGERAVMQSYVEMSKNRSKRKSLS